MVNANITGAHPLRNNEGDDASHLANFFKILLVEDNQIAAKVAKSILLALGCEIDIAETGKKALELTKRNHYDLIFMDIGLPDIDGYRVAQRIRSHPKMLNVPIVALTAHAGDEEKQRCLALGMKKVIAKPLTKKQAAFILATLIPAGVNCYLVNEATVDG